MVVRLMAVMPRFYLERCYCQVLFSGYNESGQRDVGFGVSRVYRGF